MRRETEAYEVMINRFYGTIFGKLSRMKQNMTLENCAKALSWPRATEPLFAHECKISSSQVLGESVAKLLPEYYPQELHGTAELFEKWINFLIAWMLRNQKEALVKRKPFLQPFQSTDDERFHCLEYVF